MREAKAVLPGASDVPRGWKKSGSHSYGRLPDNPQLASTSQGFRASDLEGYVGFGVHTYKDRKDATSELADFRKKSKPSQRVPVRIASSDEAYAVLSCFQQPPSCGTMVLIRVGSVWGYVNLNVDTDRPTDPKVLNSAARGLVERIRQAQRGERPTAKIS
ncbi:hypothetical protein ACQB60_06145 [Actinomycetota bacterium Odt1-20B]